MKFYNLFFLLTLTLFLNCTIYAPHTKQGDQKSKQDDNKNKKLEFVLIPLADPTAITVTCPLCLEQFPPNKIKRHMTYRCKKRPNRLPRSCQFCKKKYSYSNVKSHGKKCSQNPNGLKKSPCPHCGKEVKHLKSHYKNCPKCPDKATCAFCQESFANQYSLKRHYKNCPQQPDSEKVIKVICFLCQQSFANQSSLNYHINHYCKQNSNRCPPGTAGICQFCEGHYIYVKRHEKDHCNLNPNKHAETCQFCQKQFINLRTHQKVCSSNPDGLKKSPCPYCKKKVKDLKDHSKRCQKNPDNRLVNELKISKKSKPKEGPLTCSIKKVVTKELIKKKKKYLRLKLCHEDSFSDGSDEQFEDPFKDFSQQLDFEPFDENFNILDAETPFLENPENQQFDRFCAEENQQHDFNTSDDEDFISPETTWTII